MSDPQRYFIAKYVADARRMEPVNIGVILWSRGRVTAKFLPPEESAPLVNDLAVYSRWVEYWMRLLAADSIEARDGSVVSKQSSQFMDAFARTQKENYLLADAGEVVDRVTARNMDAAATYLYSELVERAEGRRYSPREQAIQLKQLSSKVLAESGVSDHDEFRHSYTVRCRIGTVEVPLRAHYAIGNGVPRSIFQRVQIGSSQSVCSASFMFEHLISNKQIKRDNCAALVYTDESHTGQDSPGETDVSTSLAMLDGFATVVNLRDAEWAKKLLSRVASSNGA